MPFQTRFRFSRWRWILLFVFCLVLALSINLRPQTDLSSTLQPAVPLLPQDPDVQVFFNQSEANVYTDPYRHITRYGDDLEQVIVTAIDQATQSVDVAVQAFNLPRIAQALVESAQRGVSVRLVLENQYANPKTDDELVKQQTAWMAIADIDQNGTVTLAESDRADALKILRTADIPLIDDTADGSKGSGLMHHKFIVIDGQQVLTGSANLTLSGIHGDGDEPESRGNANALLKINSATLASHFTDEFNEMWGDGPRKQPDSRFGLQKSQRSAQQIALPNNGASSTITLQFSPLSASQPWISSGNGLIAKTLSQASRSVDLALFVFSEQRIANQLEAQVQTGVALRGLIEPTFAYRSYSEALDMLGVTILDRRCRIEADNNPWERPIKSVGLPHLLAGDKLHHKFAIIDGKTVIVGSHNWSHAANTQNDETILILENKTVAAHFNREFERLYRDAALGQTDKLRYKIEQAQQRCM